MQDVSQARVVPVSEVASVAKPVRKVTLINRGHGVMIHENGTDYGLRINYRDMPLVVTLKNGDFVTVTTPNGLGLRIQAESRGYSIAELYLNGKAVGSAVVPVDEPWIKYLVKVVHVPVE